MTAELEAGSEMIVTVPTAAEAGSRPLRERRRGLVVGPAPKIIRNVHTCAWSRVALFLLLGEGVRDSNCQVNFEDEDRVCRQNKEHGGGT